MLTMWNRCAVRMGLLSLVLPILAACAGQARYGAGASPEQRQDLLRGDVFYPQAAPLPTLEPVDLLAVNAAMRAFLDRHVPATLPPRYKAERILRALLDDGLQLHYSNLKTFSAAETFAAREGNCLSFTNLYIALARAAGIRASYQEVKIAPSWNAVGDTHYLNLHINVLLKLPKQRQVVDFDTRIDSANARARPINDRAAAAQYYNNMAIFHMTEGNLPVAFLHARQAIDMRPDTGYFWTNLGTIFKRAGAPEQAEQAWLLAIGLSGELSAVSNLARLYQWQGKPELAQQYRQRALAFRMKNPYYLYRLAQTAYTGGDYAEANRLLLRAVKKRNDAHEFYRLLGLSWLQLGQADKAKRSFRAAAKLVSDPQNAGLYARKLQLLAETQGANR